MRLQINPNIQIIEAPMSVIQPMDQQVDSVQDSLALSINVPQKTFTIGQHYVEPIPTRTTHQEHRS